MLGGFYRLSRRENVPLSVEKISKKYEKSSQNSVWELKIRFSPPPKSIFARPRRAEKNHATFAPGKPLVRTLRFRRRANRISNPNICVRHTINILILLARRRRAKNFDSIWSDSLLAVKIWLMSCLYVCVFLFSIATNCWTGRLSEATGADMKIRNSKYFKNVRFRRFQLFTLRVGGAARRWSQ